MKKNLFKKALALAMCATTVFSVVGCGEGGGGVDDDETSSVVVEKPIDENKTQITFTHFNSGYGDKWTYELAAAFEEVSKNTSYEEGKMGVQVHVRGEKVAHSAQAIKSNTYDVYFLEGPADYTNMLATNAFESLDGIVKEVSPYDGKKIVDKLNPQQQAFFGNDSNTYYTLPHYAGNYGIIYNADLFEENGFYFAETMDPEDGNRLIGPGRETKSKGLDGKAGTYDDGLPTTYEEFFYLCGEINARGIDPVCFPGKYVNQHVAFTMDGLAGAADGAAQRQLNYTLTGTATNLIKVNADGSAVLQGGQPVLDAPKEITPENAYELSRQAGYYYAFNFIETLLGNTDYYNEEDGENTAWTHHQMEQGFLEYGKLGITEQAMLLDGTWWQMDANATFERLTKEDQKWSKENRNFGLMPFPQPTKAEAEKVANGTKKQVFADTLFAVSGVKAGLPEGKKKAALAFLQYAYSDQALCDFTYSTGAPIGVDYLDTIDMTKLNPWEKSVINYMRDCEVLYPVSSTAKFKQNHTALRGVEKYATPIGSVQDAVWSIGYTAGNYFKAFQKHFKGIAWANA